MPEASASGEAVDGVVSRLGLPVPVRKGMRQVGARHMKQWRGRRLIWW